jgi:hypothetical protein
VMDMLKSTDLVLEMEAHILFWVRMFAVSDRSFVVSVKNL